MNYNDITMKYVIANWKANKTLEEAQAWIKEFIRIIEADSNILMSLEENRLTVVIAPTHPLIYPLKEMLGERKNIYFGSQDLSSVEEGSYTGEVTAKSLSSLIKFALIGHSERRNKLNETEDLIGKKIDLSKKYNIDTILCVRGTQDKVYENAVFVAYEPVYAIGTGNNEDVSTVLKVRNELSLKPGMKFIYGASVDSNNCREYLEKEEIDGLLVGTASLDPTSFCSILEKV